MISPAERGHASEEKIGKITHEGNFFHDETIVSAKGYQELLRKAAALLAYHKDVFVDPDLLIGKKGTGIKVYCSVDDFYFSKALEYSPNEWQIASKTAFWNALKEFSKVDDCVGKVGLVKGLSSIDPPLETALFDHFRFTQGYIFSGSTREKLSTRAQGSYPLVLKPKVMDSFINAIEKVYEHPGKLAQRRFDATFTFKEQQFKIDRTLFTIKIKEKTVKDPRISNYDNGPFGITIEIPEAL